MIRLFFNDVEVSLETLQQAFNNLEYDRENGAEESWWDELVVEDIKDNRIYFTVSRQSAY